MRDRRNLPIAALRAFEAAARCGKVTAAAEELSVTHGAISRHVSHLEDFVGVQLFEGARNRPRLTMEGRVFGFALTKAFDQIDDAVRMVARANDSVLDVSCLSTFAMRWLIPRLYQFAERHPQYDVRLATDERPPRHHVDIQIFVLPPDAPLVDGATLLFEERLGLVLAPGLVPNEGDVFRLPRLETRTRPHVWTEWLQLINKRREWAVHSTRLFDHYHMTIEGALSGLGVAIAPWHLVAEEIKSGRLVAPFGFLQSEFRYAVRAGRPGRKKAQHFVNWLRDAVAAFPGPPQSQ